MSAVSNQGRRDQVLCVIDDFLGKCRKYFQTDYNSHIFLAQPLSFDSNLRNANT